MKYKVCSNQNTSRCTANNNLKFCSICINVTKYDVTFATKAGGVNLQLPTLCGYAAIIVHSLFLSSYMQDKTKGEVFLVHL